MHPNQSETLANELVEAIRAWHRGLALSAAQVELIDQARRATLGRALGLQQ